MLQEMDNKCALNEFAMTMVFGIGIILAVANTIVSILVNYVKKKTLLITVQVGCTYIPHTRISTTVANLYD